MGRLSRPLTAAFLAATLFGGALAAQADDRRIAYVFATQSGEPALDGDRFGGNPFASAVIAALSDPEGDAEAILIGETMTNSGEFQVPDLERMADVSLHPLEGERAYALVLVVADYGSDDGLVSLPGAAFDATRLTAAFARAGYITRIAVARSAAEYRDGLARFNQMSAEAERAVLYTTGHGGEVDGEIRLLMPEFDADPSISDSTISLDEVSAAMAGRKTNLLLYAGCRDNPFAAI